MDNNFYTFKKKHNIINRIYNMLVFMGTLKYPHNEKVVKRFLNHKIEEVDYIETIAKFFESKKKLYKKNQEVICNLNALVYDLEYLKQYLS